MKRHAVAFDLSGLPNHEKKFLMEEQLCEKIGSRIIDGAENGIVFVKNSASVKPSRIIIDIYHASKKSVIMHFHGKSHLISRFSWKLSDSEILGID